MKYAAALVLGATTTMAETFENSKAMCAQQGKRLPTPRTREEMLLQGNGGIYWTGWTWSPTQNKYVNTYTGEPAPLAIDGLLRDKDKSEFPNSALGVGFGTNVMVFQRTFDMTGVPFCVASVSTRTLSTLPSFLKSTPAPVNTDFRDNLEGNLLSLFSDNSGEKTTELGFDNDVIARTGFNAEQTSVPTCVFSNGLTNEEVPLFTTTCEMDKFVIRLNDGCRQQKYSFIDFEHDTFVWGDESIKWDPTRADNSGNVNWLSELMYSGMPIPSCPGIRPTVDFDSNELNWNVEYTTCAIDTVSQPGKVQYSLYLNSFSPDGFVQVNQVAFRCSFENRYNVTSEVVSISNDEGMFDNVEQKDEIDFADYLTLNVYTASGNEWSPAGNMAYQLGTDLGGLSYTELAAGQTVRLGDHVQLKIELKDGVDMDEFYDFSLYKCWAEVDQQELNLWDDYCPRYNWVGPDRSESVFNGVGAYLNTYWDNEVATELRVVGLRQFAFAAPNGIEPTLTYHCTVKICLDGDQSCSTTDPVGETISVCNLNQDAEHSLTRVNRSTADREVEVSKTVRVSMEPRSTCIKRDGLCLSKKTFTEEELVLLMKPDGALAHVASLLLAIALLIL